MPRANLAVSIIARNAAKTVGACLDSIVPYVREVVVCVDERTNDQTVKVARKHGAKVYGGLKVSDWHECEYHGKVLAQHFARARQEAFSRLPKDVDWYMWIDADDIVKGGEKLHEFLPKLAPEVAGVWLPYHYSQAGKDGPTSTLFDRERIVRANMPWQWLHRVHEILAPVGCATEQLNWVRTDDVAVYHQGEGHDTQGSARRNILLLEIDLEENPEDTRALFYLGNQYFALGDWATAAEYYERSTAANNPYQVWQTYIYLSMAYERLGDLDSAKRAAYQAIDVAPYHPEPYYRLAAVDGLLRGDVQRCEFWTQEGHRKVDAPFFAFRNPLDKTYNAPVTLGQAYMNAGFISRAREQFERAAKVVPAPDIVRGLEDCRKLEQETQAAEAFVALAKRGVELPTPIPESLWKFGRVRDIVVPRLLSARVNTQPRIIFWCGRSIEPWAPPSLNTTGIGGSETAVVQIAKRFAADGWRVDVYNEPDKFEGEYDGVGYWGCNRFTQGEVTEVLVSWRNPRAYDASCIRRVSLLWCHDLNAGPDAAEHFRRWDKVLGVSAWHAAYLSQVYGTDAAYVPNGIELERFTEPVKKVPFRCVYASSQDRGLLELLQLWPMFTAVEPTAELHVAYGWENFDKWIAMGNGHLAQLKAAILPLLEQQGVVWRGRLPQDELAKLYQESYAWLYPTAFLEVSCISAMEAMAGGCVPVTSAAGALPETIGDGGLVVTGNVYSAAWKEFWASCAKAVLLSPDVRLPLAQKGMERARGLTWDASYEQHWKPIVADLLASKEVVRA